RRPRDTRRRQCGFESLVRGFARESPVAQGGPTPARRRSDPRLPSPRRTDDTAAGRGVYDRPVGVDLPGPLTEGAAKSLGHARTAAALGRQDRTGPREDAGPEEPRASP